MKSKSIFPYLFLLVLLVQQACKKDEPVTKQETPKGQLTISFSHNFGGVPLLFDTVKYDNAAGNKISFSSLEYYASGFQLLKGAGDTVNLGSYVYLNGRNDINEIILKGIPGGTYTGIRFCIGLTPDLNTGGKLDNTPQNVNMQWPEVIGGGYHFLKMEGLYRDSTGKNQGYAVHLGSQPMLVQHQVIPVNITLSDGGSAGLDLVMDLNEWFRNPYTYDLVKDGNYTMAIPSLMALIRDNGKDTFHEKN